MTKAQAQQRLDSITRRPYLKPKPPLSGIEKAQAELTEANVMWRELRRSDD